MGRTFVAFEGTELGRLLDDDVEQSLREAIAVIDDQLIEEIAARFVDPDTGNGGTFFDQHLPRMYRACRFIHWPPAGEPETRLR
jgi:hypothetical protein